jgi:hypothetical protein
MLQAQTAILMLVDQILELLTNRFFQLFEQYIGC